MLDSTLAKIRRFIPAPIFKYFNPAYHRALSLASAIWYRFPSRKIKIIAVTGTKGKSSTVEIVNAILEEAGFKTALSNTIRYKIGADSHPNLFKMSMPGRFFVQKLIRRAVKADCDYLILEMTSQGAILNRHAFVNLDVLIFTNISPEHIEAHGSYEKYRDAKLSIARSLSASPKPNRTIIVNADEEDAHYFLECPTDRKFTYNLEQAKPFTVKSQGLEFTLNGKLVRSPLSGKFNLYNILASVSLARSQNISDAVIIRAIEKFADIPGRVQKVDAGQPFEVVVDYAHTPDSLEKFYQVFHGKRTICVLGGTGGGRDSWKRKRMGEIADQYCAEIILTDEDPYDEDPRAIVNDVASGIKNKKPLIIMDRRAAIGEAFKRSNAGDAVLITGKGTDPYIMGPNGTKTPWSDARIAREEILKQFPKA